MHRVEITLMIMLWNHLNIKSLGNYSGIHPSLITVKWRREGENVVKIIVEKINHTGHGGDVYEDFGHACDIAWKRMNDTQRYTFFDAIISFNY